MTTEETYVTAAFLVLLAVVLLYVIIYAFKMRRLEREVRELEGQTEPEARTAAGLLVRAGAHAGRARS